MNSPSSVFLLRHRITYSLEALGFVIVEGSLYRLVHLCLQITKGTNAYSILSSPRAPGLETIVISASWLSRTGEGGDTLNLRGVSTVLALASFLKRQFFVTFLA
jgi:Gaa1-like, GPI transamidase component